MSSTQLEGKTIGKYQIRRKVGDGGQAIVYEAWYEDLQASVAIKFLHDSIAQNSAIRERFKREARLQFKLQHPHIIRVLEIIEDDGVMGMVMDWVQGPDLADYLKKRTAPLTSNDLELLFLPVLRALDFAHKKGVIHRDLKPANVLVDLSSGTPIPKVMDFGIAKSLEDEGQQTKTNALLGTPHYIAPEQANSSKHVDHRADIYSLGVMLYEMLCGRQPFAGRDLLQLITAHLLEPPPPMRDWGVRVAPALEAIAQKALAKSPNERFESCQAFEQALQKVLAQHGTSVLSVPLGMARPLVLPTEDLSDAAFLATENALAVLPSVSPREPMIPSGSLDIVKTPHIPNDPREQRAPNDQSEQRAPSVQSEQRAPSVQSEQRAPNEQREQRASLANSLPSSETHSTRRAFFFLVLASMASLTFLVLSFAFGSFPFRTTAPTKQKISSPTISRLPLDRDATPHAKNTPAHRLASVSPRTPPHRAVASNHQPEKIPTPPTKSMSPQYAKRIPPNHPPQRIKRIPPNRLLPSVHPSHIRTTGSLRKCLRCLQHVIAPVSSSLAFRSDPYGSNHDIVRAVRSCAVPVACNRDMTLFCQSLHSVKVPIPPFFNTKKNLLDASPLGAHMTAKIVFANQRYFNKHLSQAACLQALQGRP